MFREKFPGPDPSQAPPVEGTAPGPMPEAPPEQPSRMAAAIGHARRAAEWVAPVAHDALKQETGTDLYDFVGAPQPELTQSQRFGSGVAQWALRRAGERIAERVAQPA